MIIIYNVNIIFLHIISVSYHIRFISYPYRERLFLSYDGPRQMSALDMDTSALSEGHLSVISASDRPKPFPSVDCHRYIRNARYHTPVQDDMFQEWDAYLVPSIPDLFIERYIVFWDCDTMRDVME